MRYRANICTLSIDLDDMAHHFRIDNNIMRHDPRVPEEVLNQDITRRLMFTPESQLAFFIGVQMKLNVHRTKYRATYSLDGSFDADQWEEWEKKRVRRK